MSDFLSRLVQRTLQQAPVMRPLILPWVNATPVPPEETQHEPTQESGDKQITTPPVTSALNHPSLQPPPSLIPVAVEHRSSSNQPIDTNKSRIRKAMEINDRSKRPDAGPSLQSFPEPLTFLPAQDTPANPATSSLLLRENTRAKGNLESSGRRNVEAPIQPDAQKTPQPLSPANREGARVKTSPDVSHNLSLPSHPTLSPRGARVSSIVGFGSPLDEPAAVPQRTRASEFTRSPRSPFPGRSSGQVEKVTNPPQKPPQATPGQFEPTPAITNTAQGDTAARPKAEPIGADPVGHQAWPVMPPTRHSEPSREEMPPTVHVTIGRIEVRAVTPPSRPKPTRQPVRPREPALSLDDYLKRRGRSR